MSAVSVLIENVMNASMTNDVPLRLLRFQGKKQEFESDRKLVIAVELQNGARGYYEIGRTKEVDSASSADVDHLIKAPYYFAELQRVKFIAYDVTKTDDITQTQPKIAGCAVVSLGQILSSRELTTEIANIGSITVRTEDGEDNRIIEFEACAEKLEKKDLFGKSDPFLEISKKESDGRWTIIHKTEHLKETLNPHWAEFSIRYQLFCGENKDKDVKFACYDYDRTGNNDLIGEAYISPAQILETSSTHSFALSNPKKKLKKKGFGRLMITKCHVKKEPSFMSYMLAGCRLNLTCGIDFTGSNGDPKQNSSLHYTGSATPNKYVLSMTAVGYILQEYGCGKQVTAYGYGAKIPPDNQVSHDFPLNVCESKSTFSGMEEVLQAYYKALDTVKLWGPTNMAPIINLVADAAEKSPDEKLNYHVLTILTDGVITDIDKTKAAIVRASRLPISIIIACIGNADFGEMEFLNKGPEFILTAGGEKSARGIVQCVSFRQFNFASMDTLGKNLLQKIPLQLVEYFASHKIEPVPYKTCNMSQADCTGNGEKVSISQKNEKKASEKEGALECDGNTATQKGSEDEMRGQIEISSF